MRVLGVLAAILFGLALAAVAAMLWDPRLFALRDAAFWTIPPAGLAGAAWLARRPVRPLLARGLALFWLAGPLLVLAGWGQLAWQRRAVLSAGPEAAALGARFVVGFRTLEEVAPLAERGLIGGVFVTRRNLDGPDGAALRAGLGALQARRRAAGLPPLFVTADQEGGIVSRLSPPLPLLPPLSDLAGLPPGAREAAAFDRGRTQGEGLAALGITANLSPVLDLRRPEAFIPGDRLSRIGERAIAADPDVVGAVGLAYGRGLLAAGVIPTAKHFPGLGRVGTDTHLAAARLDAPVPLLEATDWIPFRRMLEEPRAWLMLAHAVLPGIDPERPASASRAVVRDLLRDRWGHAGVAITDDLTMHAAFGHGLCAMVVDGLNAGVDLLLLAYDVDQYHPAMACALAAARGGRLDPAAQAESLARLARARGPVRPAEAGAAGEGKATPSRY